MISFIEDQHKLIEKKLEELKDVIVNREDSIYNSKDILDDLILYYDVHFYSENKLIEKYLTPEQIKKHESEHKDFLNKLNGLKDKDFITIDIYKQLKDWGSNHINYSDIPLFETIQSTNKVTNDERN